MDQILSNVIAGVAILILTGLFSFAIKYPILYKNIATWFFFGVLFLNLFYTGWVYSVNSTSYDVCFELNDVVQTKKDATDTSDFFDNCINAADSVRDAKIFLPMSWATTLTLLMMFFIVSLQYLPKLREKEVEMKAIK